MIIDSEFESLIPPLTEEEYKGLEESILAEGCRDALTCWGDVLVDGHNRYKICTEHNLIFTTIERDFADKDEAKLWIMKNQLSRRNLNDFQRIEITHKCEDAVKAKAKERMLMGKSIDPMVKLSQGTSRDELGSMAGVSGSTYERAVAVVEEAPAPVVEAVRNNDLSIHAAYEVTKMPEAERTEVAERIESGEKPKDVVAEVRSRAGVSKKKYEKAVEILEEAPEEMKEAIRKGDVSIDEAHRKLMKEKKKAERETAIAEQLEKPRSSSYVDVNATDKKYRVIYADPPWQYNDKQDTEKLGGAVKHYPTMPLNEICELPVANLTEDNAVLFLWTTSPMLEDAFKVINTWGFKYKSSFIWDKVSHAMGHYNSVRHEFLLIGVKGSCTPDVPKLFDSVVSIERTEHSRKPKEFREMIDTLYPVGDRLEMFARESVEGWDVWGNMA